jgi:hypothetical protein
MPIIPKFKVKILHGGISFEDLDKYQRYVQSLDGEYELIIQRPRKDRSNAQNRYFHGVILPMFAENGDTVEFWKNHLKDKFLSYESNGRRSVRETSGLSTVEMEEFNENCRRYGAVDFGLNIPLPNEVDYTKYDPND